MPKIDDTDSIPLLEPDEDGESEGFEEQPTAEYIKDGRSTVKEALQGLDEPWILNGEGMRSLSESIKEYTLVSGDRVTAATDMGIGYPKDRNEDRVVVSPTDNLAVVIDGMGGYANGDKAAQYTAEAFLKNPNDPKAAARHASRLMKQNKLTDDDGACFASVNIVKKNDKKYVDISQAGNVKVLIFADGKLTFQTKDDSYAQQLIDAKAINEDEALYFPDNHVVTKSIGKKKAEIKKLASIPVKKGSIVMILSDGITDNIIPEEIESRIAGLTPSDIIRMLSDITGERMANAQKIILDTDDKKGGRSGLGMYVDGFKGTPKPDNRGVVVIEIN